MNNLRNGTPYSQSPVGFLNPLFLSHFFTFTHSSTQRHSQRHHEGKTDCKQNSPYIGVLSH